MPMPEVFNLANVNEAISQASIISDNHVMVDRYQSELHDCEKELILMPGKDRIEAHNDPINGPIPLNDYCMFQDFILRRFVKNE